VGPGVATGSYDMTQRTRFVGHYEHGIDEKGRMVLPAKIRAQIGESGMLGMNDRCLALWTQEGFDVVAEGLRQRVDEGELEMDIFRTFYAHAAEVNPDQQGRIVVPPVLRAYAGLGRDAVIIGAHDRAEIWDKARWNEVTGARTSQVAEAMASLRI
jgi:MraZ protein